VLAAGGGLAPDLLGFGRSSKAGNLEYTLPAYVDFVQGFLDALGIEEVALVGHGWGAAIGLLFAQRHPERVQRLAIVDALPLFTGFTWPRIVGYLRRPGIGELVMGSITKGILARMLRAGSTSPKEVWSNQRVNAVWDQLDQGTQRAILRLLRSADDRTLSEAGAGLDRLDQPALVIWGERDPWLAPGYADAFGDRLRNATVTRVAGAGHWPWLDDPAVRDRLCDFAQDVWAR
jgi:pimeloyl-ACP methyl ester carboxylesterase